MRGINRVFGINRKTLGDRGEVTCHRLWQRIPRSYRRLLCFTDFWAAYGKVISEDQHCPGGKESGQTNHRERWNNTLRQRLARFVRQPLSFSKSGRMHKVSLLLFVHDYNRSKMTGNNTE